ncbi:MULTISPECIES: glycosyltransferase [Devosia]|uniref:Undecaprenyl-phosphate mannosyltransferase n=1 Tax=Devosia equisanguinis TaxID=2490941 RepID=A0A447ICV4_9HYPH|nr:MULTISPECIES: glycosyltransferase [Devosia]ODT47619.1 MAG: glycosyl transferase [Pelagibacterium sp. SCN 63-126]ODU86429.1 MAG: glycosyl transferase [Pelagibacterium sp. SCN 63-17]OJX42674.1 MAG: glycosyl transferase [Devosia sp. 63-57]VDS05303.1 Undecaprenyl-phosphate mannosyltransferase [Devosia equisanguinis]
MTKLYRGNSVAVILPCYNEVDVIASVIAAFRAALPEAAVYVFDNNSSDGTAAAALAAGAIVRHVPQRGKGNVVRRQFADVDADVYVMADGDGTYDASQSRILVDTLLDGGLDMVVGTRRAIGDGEEYRPGHVLGNKVLTGTVANIFGRGFSDMLSGYRVLSRRFVKSFPALSRGFEIETELTIHALELRAPYAEVPTAYGSRIEGSTSKLNTIRDGFSILEMILRLFARERPRQLYLSVGIVTAIISLLLAIPVFIDYFETGLVPRFPTAILSGLGIIASLILGAMAAILDSVVTGRREAKRLRYLEIPAPRVEARQAQS